MVEKIKKRFRVKCYHMNNPRLGVNRDIFYVRDESDTVWLNGKPFGLFTAVLDKPDEFSTTAKAALNHMPQDDKFDVLSPDTVLKNIRIQVKDMGVLDILLVEIAELDRVYKALKDSNDWLKIQTLNQGEYVYPKAKIISMMVRNA